MVTRAALSVFRAHPRLVAFPAAGLALTLALLPAALWLATRGVARATVVVVRATGAPQTPVLALLLYLGLALGVGALAATLGATNAALAHAVDGVVEGEAVAPVAAVRAALGVVPALLAYGALAGLVGLFAAPLERGTRSRGLFAAVAGTSYSALTYLLGPVAVLERASPQAALWRGADLLERRFGPAPVPSLGVLLDGAVVGAVPLVVVQTLLLVDAVAGTGFAEFVVATPGVVAVPLALFWAGVVVGTAAGTVGRTALYRALADGRESLPLLETTVTEAVDLQGDRPTDPDAVDAAPAE
jgi:hypothetical protein